jgi:hypothetical protein
MKMKKLLVTVAALLLAIGPALATPPGGIGFVNSSDLKCRGDSCVFNNRSDVMCASGWSIAVFDSPQGSFIGWLATSRYPESGKLVFKRWHERSRDGFTYLHAIEGEGENFDAFFTPGDNKENRPVRPVCG